MDWCWVAFYSVLWEGEADGGYEILLEWLLGGLRVHWWVIFAQLLYLGFYIMRYLSVGIGLKDYVEIVGIWLKT